jgi:AcrR family transcriptional regulator
MTSTETREALTREAIVATTRTLIETEGLDAVSLRRVGAALGVTAPALYAHVADKRDLLRSVAASAFALLIQSFESVDDPDPVERVRGFSRAYIEFAHRNPELFKTMFLFPPDLAIGTPTGEELPMATLAFRVPLTAMTEAMDAGTFKAMDPDLAGLTMWVAAHGCAEVLALGFALDDASRDALIDSVIETTINGFRA